MAYAAVISLKHSVESLIDPINPEISKSAHEELKLLEDVLKRLDRSTNSRTNRRVINELDAQITKGVWRLEDVLESYALHHSLQPSDVEQEIDSFLEIAKKMREEYERELDNRSGGVNDDAASASASASSIDDDFSGKKSTMMVGLSDQCKKISDELLDSQSRCKIVSLVGMAGIGKTFLARNIYKHLINVRPSNVPQFKLKAWASVGPTRKMENVLLDILSQVEDRPIASYTEHDKHKLADCLYKSLYRRRYFIVLDDIWNTDDWGYLMNFFPDDKNDSRLLLTTRLEKVPYPSETMYMVHNMRLLTNEESWNLLEQKVFGEEESSPPQLEKAGKKIAEKCEGLPLLILTVAKILRDHKQTDKEESWMDVAENSATFPDAYEEISEVLSSSYEYLPQHLKACFLYMGVFPQNYEIPLSKLINLWTVEDFLEPSQSPTLEDFAIKCVKELVSKSLVMFPKHSSNVTIKSCKLHSAYWSMCVKEARKKQFLLVLSKFTSDFEEYITSQQRRWSVQNNILFAIREARDSMDETTLTLRSLLFTGEYNGYSVPIDLHFVLLKVFDALAVRFYEFPYEVLELLQLKYLALTHNGNLPSLISKLQKLQSLIIRQHHSIKLARDSSTYYLPKEIWDMQELRHLRIMGNYLPDPSKEAELPNLLTLHIEGHSCSEDVFRRTPKLKKLGIKIELRPRSTETLRCFGHISILEKLETLKCVVVNPRPWSQAVAPPNHPSASFPTSLKKLSLNGLGYSWEHMSAIGSLPHLQVLKLRCFAFQGEEWNTQVEEFQSLEFLLLEDIDLVYWTATTTTDNENLFPHLKRLIVRHCYKLEEIPSQIENIDTLEMIEIVDCHPSVMILAQKILELKKSFANNIQVPITSSLNLPFQDEEIDDGTESDGY